MKRNSQMHFLNYFIESLLQIIFTLTHDWGSAVVVLTCLTRLLLFPLQWLGYRQSRRLSKIASDLKLIAERYKELPLEAFRRTQKLKKENGVSGLQSLLAAHIPLPLFLSLYQVLTHLPSLASASFLYLTNLSAPDPYYVLPALVALGSYFLQRTSPPVQTEAHANPAFRMIKCMPALNFVFMIAMPSA
ncbi:MAG: membrane protein insertase YidC, partial [Proteobacteria bacterium]